MSNPRAKFASWEAVTLGAVCVFKGGSGFKESFQGTESGEHPFIKVSDLNLPGNEKYVLHSNNWVSAAELKLLKATLQPIGATVFAKVGAALKLNRRRVLVRPTVIDNNMMAAIPDEMHLNREYLYYFLLGEDLGRFSQESAVPSINQGHLESIQIPLPPLAEQRKIAEILRTWDEAIETAEAELKAKQERKRWQLQNALKQASKEVKHLNTVGSYFHPLSERNSEGLAPLSVTQDAGVVLRSDMTRRISYDEDTIGTYKVVRPNNFIISLRSFEGGIEMSDVTGCVSPAYQVFGPNPGVNVRYFRHYFKSQDFVKRLAVTVFGIRDGKQISYSHFSEVKIPVLTHDAQEQLADVADATELDIKLSLERLSKLREQKRGLMQKLLTGEVRVAA